jgi:hypothetical protein
MGEGGQAGMRSRLITRIACTQHGACRPVTPTGSESTSPQLAALSRSQIAGGPRCAPQRLRRQHARSAPGPPSARCAVHKSQLGWAPSQRATRRATQGRCRCQEVDGLPLVRVELRVLDVCGCRWVELEWEEREDGVG